MEFSSIGSGSKGNGTLVRLDDTLLLIDCGFSIKETERRLQLRQVHPKQITALLVTHEHGDHARGILPLSRKYKIPVYLTYGTAKAIKATEHPYLHVIHCDESFGFDRIAVYPVAVPHDAKEPVQFLFDVAGKGRLGVLTDLGMISSHVEEHYKHCDALLIECNHDLEMLYRGAYPPSLKERVSSNWGHLNNQQTAEFLRDMDQQRLQHLVIAHISENNNTRALAENALALVLETMEQVTWADQAQGFDWLSISSNKHATLKV